MTRVYFGITRKAANFVKIALQFFTSEIVIELTVKQVRCTYTPVLHLCDCDLVVGHALPPQLGCR